MQRHHLHAVFPCIGLIFTGLQHGVRQETRDRQHLGVGFGLIAARRTDQLVQVLDSRFAAVASLLLVVRQQPAGSDDVVDLLVQRQWTDLLVDVLDQPHEGVQALTGACAELLDARTRGFPHRACVGTRVVANRIQRLRTDAARRQVHDALERRIVGAAEDQAQVTQCVFDFRALEEPQPAIHAIRNARSDQRFFERSRLSVRAIQDRAVAAPPASVRPFADAVDDEIRFVALVERRVQLDRLAGLASSPQILAEPSVVVRDERIRRREDVAGRAIVLLEAKQLHVRIVAPELLQILDACSAPSVNALIVVADRERQSLRARQQLDPRELNRVRVLKLVDEDMTEARAIVRKHVGPVAPQLERAQLQLCEVDYATALALLLVLLVNLDELAARRIAVVLQVLRAQAFVLARVDEPHDLFRDPARFVEIERLE